MHAEQLEAPVGSTKITYAWAVGLLFAAYLLDFYHDYSSEVDATYVALGALARLTGQILAPAILCLVLTFRRGSKAKANGWLSVCVLTATVAIFALKLQ